jgi:hypothetical protein
MNLFVKIVVQPFFVPQPSSIIVLLSKNFQEPIFALLQLPEGLHIVHKKLVENLASIILVEFREPLAHLFFFPGNLDLVCHDSFKLVRSEFWGLEVRPDVGQQILNFCF